MGEDGFGSHCLKIAIILVVYFSFVSLLVQFYWHKLKHRLFFFPRKVSILLCSLGSFMLENVAFLMW